MIKIDRSRAQRGGSPQKTGDDTMTDYDTLLASAVEIANDPSKDWHTAELVQEDHTEAPSAEVSGTRNAKMAKTAKDESLNPFLAFLCFDIPALGLAVWAILMPHDTKASEAALSWALTGVKLRIAVSVFIAFLGLWTAIKTGTVSLNSLHSFFLSLQLLLDGLCDSLSLSAMFF